MRRGEGVARGRARMAAQSRWTAAALTLKCRRHLHLTPRCARRKDAGAGSHHCQSEVHAATARGLLTQGEAVPAGCKLVSPRSPSHGQSKCYFCQLRYFVLLYSLAVRRTVPNCVGPSATRRECHILLKKKSLMKRAYIEHKFYTKKCKASLV